MAINYRRLLSIESGRTTTTHRTLDKTWLSAVAVLLFATVAFTSAAAFAAEYVVNSTSDLADSSPGDGSCQTQDGDCSFRAALMEANATPASDAIRFAIGAVGSLAEFTVRSPLPVVGGSVQVDGRSQGGPGYEGSPLVVLAGSQAGGGTSGLVIQGADASVDGLAVVEFPGTGVIVDGGDLRGSYVGVDPDGVTARPNRGDGVSASNGAMIGGPIGGTTPCSGDCNLISGNVRSGLNLSNQGVVVRNNQIGTGVAGTENMGNGRHGVFVPLSSLSVPSDHQIGAPGQGNVVAFNGFTGIAVEATQQQSPVRILIGANQIFGNGALPIDLGNDGVSPNDADDTDSGPNELLNWPILTAIIPRQACGFTVRGIAPAGADVDVFLSAGQAEDRSARVWLLRRKEGGSGDNASGISTTSENGVDVTGNLFEFDVTVDRKNLRLSGFHLTSSLADQGTSELSPIYRSSPVTNGSLGELERCSLGLDLDDEDSDGDGVDDVDELGDGEMPLNTDGDSLIDALDPDDDNDGIPTLIERQQSVGIDLDLDGDGLPPWRDADSDGDGISDFIEWTRDADSDVDSDGLVSFLDVDSDDDGLCDGTAPSALMVCAGGEDADQDGTRDDDETSTQLADSDSDGVCDGPASASGCAAGPDNCPLISNPDQDDSGGGNAGDACDCGDGLVAQGEQCDDGNQDQIDGCLDSCQRLPGFTCSGQPSVCVCADAQTCGRLCYSDEDGDGVSGTEQIIPLDRQCAGFSTSGRQWSVEDGGDCDDENALASPLRTETCDSIDNDCDGLVDDEDPDIANLDPIGSGASRLRQFVDNDEDGCGRPGTGKYFCQLPSDGFASNGDDEDDTDGVCCGNGSIEEGEACDLGAIGDASCPSGTTGTRICGNQQVAGNCTLLDASVTCAQGAVCYLDADGDGFAGTPIEVSEGTVCSELTDSNGTPYRSEPEETCNDDPADRCGALTFPGAVDVCDACDNDCDDTTADGFAEPGFGDACDGIDRDDCLEGTIVCNGVQLLCTDDTDYTPEICDEEGVDEDCDGLVNDDDPDIEAREKESGATEFSIDSDGDGCGVETDETFFACGASFEGFAPNSLDLSDQDGFCCALDEFADDPRCGGNSTCGNGVVDPGEGCDPAEGSVPGCRFNCTFCGDGVLQEAAGENCEIAGPDSFDACRDDCTFCGDGIIQQGEGEECDDGNSSVEPCACDESDCTVCGESCMETTGERADSCGEQGDPDIAEPAEDTSNSGCATKGHGSFPLAVFAILFLSAVVGRRRLCHAGNVR